MKDVQATGEALRPQKRTSNTSKQNLHFLIFFSLILLVIFLHLDLDVDPGLGSNTTKINADPCLSGTTTLLVIAKRSPRNLHPCEKEK
jgi:hypothetical protein